MKLLMFGPPGAGKGSVSARIHGKLDIPHIAAGDIVREESKKADSKVKPYMEKGELVPDELIMELVGERLSRDDCKDGFILDGFPRTIKQAEFLEQKGIQIDRVVNLEVDEEELVRRLSGRRMDPDTGEIYNINTMEIPEGVDKGKLVQRPDDKPDVIRNRIGVYKKQTQPLIEHYRGKGVLRDVDANPALPEVVENVLAVLKDA